MWETMKPNLDEKESDDLMGGGEHVDWGPDGLEERLQAAKARIS